MRKVFYFLGNIVVMIVAIILYSLTQQFYFYPSRVKKAFHLSSSSYVVLTVAVTIGVLLLLAFIYRKQLQKQNKWDFNRKPHWGIRRILVAIAGFLLLTLTSILLPKLLGINGDSTSNNQTILNGILRSAGNFYFPMIVLIAPIFEETIFRGFFFNTFFPQETTSSKWLGILFSGFVFGYIHDPTLTKYLFLYWALGCILAWTYTTTKDLRYSMIAHMLYNSLGFL
ncbi:CPBP family intramembrane glutamic endopeptidase [Lactobacillus xylocopicola]|uniref:Membrane protein n=1 Tax=Lactobacillus xylocopicola TaxID=2976676 RepID=A0ABM8BIU0_9LACO|nr:CPBP family intramembrane glutamic endopeptidase [Lactobacillus xylocopicola]BDR61227.1 membrane protein [Lactobacillus xylocopicola]